MIRFSRQQEPLPIKQSKTLSWYGCRKEKDACIHMDPLPWKDSAMERQEDMDAVRRSIENSLDQVREIYGRTPKIDKQ